MTNHDFLRKDGMNYGLWKLSTPRTAEQLRQVVRSILIPPATFHENVGLFWDKTVNGFGSRPVFHSRP